MREIEQYREILGKHEWQCSDTLLPTAVAEWLLHTASLTEKLQGICSELVVEIVGEGWQAVEPEQNSAKQWVREVVLKCGERDWIFAQTILPESTIQNVAAEVLTLGERPIGLWLFPQNPQRLSLEWQQDTHSALYARRSLLQLKSYPIEIRELFLPHFPFKQ